MPGRVELVTRASPSAPSRCVQLDDRSLSRLPMVCAIVRESSSSSDADVVRLPVPFDQGTLDALLEWHADNDIRSWSMAKVYDAWRAASWAHRDDVEAACLQHVSEVVARNVKAFALGGVDAIRSTGDLTHLIGRDLQLSLPAAHVDNSMSVAEPDDLVIIAANVFRSEDDGQTSVLVSVRFRDLPDDGVKDLVIRGDGDLRQRSHVSVCFALRLVDKMLKSSDELAWVSRDVVKAARKRVFRDYENDPLLSRRMSLRTRVVRESRRAPLSVHVNDVYAVFPFPKGVPETEEDKEETSSMTVYDDPGVRLLSFALYRAEHDSEESGPPCFVPNFNGSEACVTNVQDRASDIRSARKMWLVMIFGGGCT